MIDKVDPHLIRRHAVIWAAREWEQARAHALVVAGKSDNFDHLTRLANAESALVAAVRDLGAVD